PLGHRLLLQADRVQGLPPRKEAVHTSHPAVHEDEVDRELLVHLDLAGTTPELGAPEPKGRVAQITNLALIELGQLPRLPAGNERVGDLPKPAIDGSLDGRGTSRLPLDLRIEVARGVCKVPPVESVDDLPHNLDVRLRHARGVSRYSSRSAASKG